MTTSNEGNIELNPWKTEAGEMYRKIVLERLRVRLTDDERKLIVTALNEMRSTQWRGGIAMRLRCLSEKISSLPHPTPDATLVREAEDALQELEDWKNAYPASIFKEPDWKKAAKVLEENGMTLDGISAATLRDASARAYKIAAPFLRAYRDLEARLRAAEAEVERLRGLFNRLLPKVNKVTSPHRHGMKPTARAMDDLSDRQLEIEEALAPTPAPPEKE